MRANPLKLKFVPKIWLIVLYYILLLFTMYLLLGKKNSKFMLPFDAFNKTDFYSHISNFIISYNLVATIALIWLLQGASWKIIMYLYVFFILINLVVERFVTVLNTPDIVDAWYGIAGVLLALIFSIAAKKFGLKDYQQFIKKRTS